MRKRLLKMLSSTRGLTLVELIITVVIILILFSIAAAGVETLKARIRFAQMKAAIDQIKNVAYTDFTLSPTHDWAPSVAPGVAPAFVGGPDLRTWPTPPCPGWTYSWDNCFGVPAVKAVRITIRRADATAIWSFCLENYGGDCAGPDFWGGTPPEISVTNLKHAYCNE